MEDAALMGEVDGAGDGGDQFGGPGDICFTVRGGAAVATGAWRACRFSAGRIAGRRWVLPRGSGLVAGCVGAKAIGEGAAVDQLHAEVMEAGVRADFIYWHDV